MAFCRTMTSASRLNVDLFRSREHAPANTADDFIYEFEDTCEEITSPNCEPVTNLSEITVLST